MSLRIHELAKRINMEGKELLALLKARNWVSADTKSVSSTVSKIYIEEIEKEFAGQIAATIAAAAAADACCIVRRLAEYPSVTPRRLVNPVWACAHAAPGVNSDITHRAKNSFFMAAPRFEYRTCGRLPVLVPTCQDLP